MAEPNDPRIYFASERTLLAWIRTGISVVGLGFVVARFGLFLEAARYGLSLKGNAPAIVDPHAHLRSLAIGVVLVLLGGASTAFAAWQHRRLCRSLSPAQLPVVGSSRFAVTFAFIVAAVSVLLAAHLLFRSELADLTPMPSSAESEPSKY
jgi:putative membrane protein